MHRSAGGPHSGSTLVRLILEPPPQSPVAGGYVLVQHFIPF